MGMFLHGDVCVCVICCCRGAWCALPAFQAQHVPASPGFHVFLSGVITDLGEACSTAVVACGMLAEAPLFARPTLLMNSWVQRRVAHKGVQTAHMSQRLVPQIVPYRPMCAMVHVKCCTAC